MASKGLLLVMADIPVEHEAEFNRWYNEEHIRKMLDYPGILTARRYRIRKGAPTYLATYDLSEPAILEKPEYRSFFGWGPSADARSATMTSYCSITLQGVYHHVLTVPASEPDDLSAARGLMVRGISVGPEHDEEFSDWYNTEHLPALTKVPGVLRGRRYRLATEASQLKGELPSYIALYDMERPEVLDSDEWKRAADTPWTKRQQRFYRPPSSLRNIYERIFPS